MDLANFEFFANTGAAVVGATVTPYPASDIHPNPNSPAAASTQTNTNGKWSFTGLPDGQMYDIKIEYGGGQVKWYKANAKINLGHLYDDRTPDTNRNLLPNGGMSGWSRWVRAGSGPLVITSATEIADGWKATISGGDSATGTRAAAPSGMNAQYCSQFAYTRVGGQLVYSAALPAWMAYALRGKAVSATAQVKQSANAGLRIGISDSAGGTESTPLSTTGSVGTITVSRTISASTTVLSVYVVTAAAITGESTLEVGNVLLDYGSVAPVFALDRPDYGLSVEESDRLVGLRTANDALGTAYADTAFLSEFVSWFAKRIKEIAGTNGWKDAVPASLNTLLSTKVAKAGDTMTGALTLANNVALRLTETPTSFRDVLKMTTNNIIEFGNVNVIMDLLGAAFRLRHQVPIQGQDSGGSYRDMLRLNGSNEVAVGSTVNTLRLLGAQILASVKIATTNNLEAAELDLTGSAAGVSLRTAAGITASTGQIRAQQLASTTTGTAPLQVASAIVVPNLNADMVDGQHASAFAGSGHNHDDAYANLLHTHSYSPLNHNHDSAYASAGHGHTNMARIASGSYAGNGAASRTISLPFTPQIVFVQRTSGDANIWILAGHDAIQLHPTDSNEVSSLTGNVPTTNGFIVTSSGPNVNGSTYNYRAIG
jgi:hypothetical protein